MNSLKLLQLSRTSVQSELRKLFPGVAATRLAPHSTCAARKRIQSYSFPTTSFSLQSTKLLHTSWTRFAFSEVERGEEFCISFDDLKKDVDSDKVQIIDVRRPDEVNEGRIPAKQFIHIPVQEVAEALQLPDSDFKEKYGVDKPSKDADVVFHCKAGGRSTFALRMAQSLGYSKARHFPGGWKEWSKKNSS